MITTSPSRPRARASRAASFLVAALAAVAAGTEAPSSARASVPATPAAFSSPLDVTNPFFPVVPGAVKVYRGRSDGSRTSVVDIYLATTREFLVDGVPVACRTMQETEFEDGALSEISVNWFAQSDDGTVYYFGETVDEYEDGAIVGHGGSWVVGAPAPGDPAGTMSVAAPAVFFPGTPEVGDEFRPEDLPDGNVEIGTIRRLARKVKVPAGRFEGCAEVREFHLPDEETETKWYAPGTGVIRTKARGEFLELEATTLRTAE